MSVMSVIYFHGHGLWVGRTGSDCPLSLSIHQIRYPWTWSRAAGWQWSDHGGYNREMGNIIRLIKKNIDLKQDSILMIQYIIALPVYRGRKCHDHCLGWLVHRLDPGARPHKSIGPDVVRHSACEWRATTTKWQHTQ